MFDRSLVARCDAHPGHGEHCSRERQMQGELLRFHEWCSVAFTSLVSLLPNDQHETSKLTISTGADWTSLADEEPVVQSDLDIASTATPTTPPACPGVARRAMTCGPIGAP